MKRFILFLVLGLIVIDAVGQSPRTRPRTRRLWPSDAPGQFIIADDLLNGEWNNAVLWNDTVMTLNGDTVATLPIPGVSPQLLSIDSTGAVAPRAFTITISDGNSVSFLDLGAAGGSMSSWTLTADSGTPEVVTDGETVDIAGGTNISTSIAATNTVTIDWAANIGDLGDVTITTPSNGEILQYNGSIWVNATAPGGFTSFTVAGDGGTPQTITDGNTLTLVGGTGLTTTAGATDTVIFDWAANIEDLTNVTITTPANGQVLSYNGSIWVNSTPAAIDTSWNGIFSVENDGNFVPGDFQVEVDTILEFGDFNQSSNSVFLQIDNVNGEVRMDGTDGGDWAIVFDPTVDIIRIGNEGGSDPLLTIYDNGTFGQIVIDASEIRMADGAAVRYLFPTADVPLPPATTADTAFMIWPGTPTPPHQGFWWTLDSLRNHILDGTGTDDQTLIYGGAGDLSIENGNSVDLSDLLDNTDNQTVDSFLLQGTTLILAVEGDLETPYTVDLSSLQDGTGTDDQTLSIDSTGAVAPRAFTLSIESGNSVSWLDLGGGGSFNNFNLAADSGTPETVDDGETVTVSGGTNISTVVSATNTVTVNWAANLNDLGDVSAPSPSNGQVLKWNGSAWVPGTDETGAGGTMTNFFIAGETGLDTITQGNTITFLGGSNITTSVTATDTVNLTWSAAINDLSDVTITTPTNGQVLKYNGSIWVNDTDAVDDADNNPTNEIQSLSISNDTLYLSQDGNVYLGGYLDNTDDQTVDSLLFSGGVLTLALEGDKEAPYTVDISGVNTDDQTVDSLLLSGTILTLTLEGDKEAPYTVDLASLQDGTGTDDQTVDSLILNGTTLILAVENDKEAPYTVDLASINTDAQTLSIDSTGAAAPRAFTISISGGNSVSFLDLGGGSMSSWTLAGDGGTPQSITDGNTATFVGGTGITTTAGVADQLTIDWAANLGDLSDVTITTPSTDQVLKYNGSIWVNGTDLVDDADNNPANELQSLSISNDTLYLSQDGNVYLGGYLDNTDAQTLSIDSTGAAAPRAFTISISGGNSVSFLDTGGGGGMTSFTVAGDGGTPQTITDANTLTLVGGTGITTTASATDQVTIDWSASINDLSDVTVTTPTVGQNLEWNGSAWVNSTDDVGESTGIRDTVYFKGHGLEKVSLPVPVYKNPLSGEWEIAVNTSEATMHDAFAVDSLHLDSIIIQTEGFFVTFGSHSYLDGRNYFSTGTPEVYDTLAPAGEINDWLWTVGDSTHLILKATRPYNPSAFEGLNNIYTASDTIGAGRYLSITDSVLWRDGLFRIAWDAEMEIGNIKLDPGQTLGAGEDNYVLTFDNASGFARFEVAGGGFTSFTLAGDGGTPQTISDGNTTTFVGGTGITTTAGATDQLTIDWAANIGDLSDVTITTPTNGQILQYNGSIWVNVAHTAPSHASTHITGGSDVIDGDRLNISWNPAKYTPSTTPTEASDVDDLTAHLYGIDQYLEYLEPDAFDSQTSGTVDFQSEKAYSREIDMTGLSSISLTLNNMVDGGAYVLWFTNADNTDTVTWPAGTIYETGASVSTDILSDGRRMIAFMYNGSNQIITGGY